MVGQNHYYRPLLTFKKGIKKEDLEADIFGDSDSELSDEEQLSKINVKAPPKEISVKIVAGQKFIQHASETRNFGAIYTSASPLTEQHHHASNPQPLHIGVIPKDIYFGEYACSLNGAQITFTRTDSLSPPPRKTIKLVKEANVIDGHINCYVELSPSHKMYQLWLKKTGTYIAKKLLKLDDAVANRRIYTLRGFPKNYKLIQQMKGTVANPRIDTYLESQGKVHRFRSPEEFNPHAEWLMMKKNRRG